MAGEKALLVDSKGRRYLVTLASGGEFHTHAGVTPHDDLIVRDEGVTVRPVDKFDGDTGFAGGGLTGTRSRALQ